MPEDMLTLPEGWDLDGPPVVVNAQDQDSLLEAISASAHVLRLIGGVVQMVAIRQELKPGSKVYVTTEYAFRWNSFVPPVAAEQNGHAEEPVVEAA